MNTIIDKYIEAYNSGDVNPDNYAQCACYLEGLRDGMLNELSQAALGNLARCIATLRGGANLVIWLKISRAAHNAGDSRGE